MNWRPRFTLRSLFVVMTICAVAVFLGLLVHQRGMRQQRAAAEISKLGGGWGFEPHRLPTEFDWCFHEIAFVNINAHVQDADLAVLDEFPKLKTLGLSDTRITEQAAPRIAALQHLEELWLDRTALGDDAVSHLAKLKKLKLLSLLETDVTDRGVAKLREELPNCEIVTHYTRRCRGCREFYQTRHISPANLCPVCEQKPASATSQP